MNAAKANNIRMEFEDNDILALLSGEHNQHLAHIEKSLDVTLDSFGNSIKISGAQLTAGKTQFDQSDTLRQ